MIIYILTNILFSALTAILAYVFLKINFDFKGSKNQIIIFISLFGGGNGILTGIWMKLLDTSSYIQMFKPILIFIFSVLVIKNVLKVNWSKTILSFLTIMVATGVGNLCTPILFSLLKIDLTTKVIAENSILYFFANILTYIVAALIVLLTQQISNFRKIKNLNLISLLFGLALIVMIISNQSFGVSFNTKTFLIEFIALFVFYIIILIFINKRQKQEEQEEERKQQEFYNKSLKETLQQLRHFKHDYSNHFSVLDFMIKSGKSEEAHNYISELCSDISNVNTAVYNIENVALFAIITNKIDKAEKSGIKLNLQVVGVVDSIPEIKVSELCSIVGIFLDNAIEAAESSTEKVIDMSIVNYVDSIDITISNSCTEKPVMGKLKNDGYSTKGFDRGHGLAIVEKILNRYKAVINMMAFDETFMRFNQNIKIKKAKQ
jgi:two-component system sensor histidine kinase AgrC